MLSTNLSKISGISILCEQLLIRFAANKKEEEKQEDEKEKKKEEKDKKEEK